jgi:hypothetical protein
MLKSVEMYLEFQNEIDQAPRRTDELYSQACANDGLTVNTWAKQWLSQIKENKDRFQQFSDKAVGKVFKSEYLKPIIVVGSGPSLKGNGQLLTDTKGIPVVSCLHNFHFFVDNKLRCDYFITLDAGKITIEEISEGGKLTHDEYVEKTKDYTLVAYVGTHPDLLKLWKGPILFFNVPVPDQKFMDELFKIEKFNQWMTSGGCVLGAATYFAKGVLGGNPLCFLGADFSFDYTHKFHGWNSKYDGQLGNAMRAHDVYGHSRKTWQSYWNFKCWFDWLAQKVPGIYINATEGGIMGAYAEGNIKQIKQMTLESFLRMYSLCDDIKDQFLGNADEYKILF